MYFTQHYLDCLSQASYLIGDETTGQAVVVDPRRDIAVDLETGEPLGLSQAGCTVKDVPEGHICCGSAGVYNIMQPELAAKLRDRKLGNIARLKPQAIAAGNIGCITQLASGGPIPVVHTIELLDWACGGPAPAELA